MTVIYWSRDCVVLLQAKKCIDEMCKAAKDPATQQAAQKFSAAVQQLRKCSKATLETLANQMSARQDQTERYSNGVWEYFN